MCFIVDEKNPNPLFAIEDIVCYKVVYKDLISLYYRFQYEIGETYKMEEDIKTYEFYGYLNNHKFIKTINNGFHSYKHSKPKFGIYNACKTLKCIIPKGSIYYHNKNENEYVSNNIKIIKIIKIITFKTKKEIFFLYIKKIKQILRKFFNVKQKVYFNNI